eukprot:5940268-Pleurochrysis_carterae.AAC.2
MLERPMNLPLETAFSGACGFSSPSLLSPVSPFTSRLTHSSSSEYALCFFTSALLCSCFRVFLPAPSRVLLFRFQPPLSIQFRALLYPSYYTAAAFSTSISIRLDFVQASIFGLVSNAERPAQTANDRHVALACSIGRQAPPIFEERDGRFRLSFSVSLDGERLLAELHSRHASEVWVLPLRDAAGASGTETAGGTAGGMAGNAQRAAGLRSGGRRRAKGWRGRAGEAGGDGDGDGGGGRRAIGRGARARAVGGGAFGTAATGTEHTWESGYATGGRWYCLGRRDQGIYRARYGPANKYYLISYPEDHPEGVLRQMCASAAEAGEGSSAWECVTGVRDDDDERTLLDLQCFRNFVAVEAREGGAPTVLILQTDEITRTDDLASPAGLASGESAYAGAGFVATGTDSSGGGSIEGSANGFGSHEGVAAVATATNGAATMDADNGSRSAAASESGACARSEPRAVRRVPSTAWMEAAAARDVATSGADTQ